MHASPTTTEDDYLEEFLSQEEHKRRFSYKKPTDQEFLEMFPEAKDILQLKIDEWEEKRQLGLDGLKKALTELYSLKSDELSTWFGEEIIKLFLFPPVTECQRHIYHIRHLIPASYKKTGSNNDNWDEQIIRARQYPIYEIAKDALSLRSLGGKYLSLCPSHTEIHPSFYLYPDSNTYHCFGCQAHGDIISLTMHLYNASFREAVKMLQK
jgi:hypothetical protein